MDGVALVVGEALVDVVEGVDGSVVERAGGSALNAAVALSRLMRPVLLATSWGPDEHGRLIADHLAGSGVHVATEPCVVPRTSVARARIGADGAATYSFDVTWRLGPVAITDVQVLHVCSLAPLLDPGAAEVDALVDRLAPTAVVSYDLNVRPAITGTGADVLARVERMVARAGIVKASDEDLAALWPRFDDEHAVTHLLGLGPRAVVVTRGREGATWHAADGRTGGVPAQRVDVADTIGAGDTFGAGLIDALWETFREGGVDAVSDEDWDRAVRHAVRCAAVTVSRVGADPPWRVELG